MVIYYLVSPVLSQGVREVALSSEDVAQGHALLYDVIPGKPHNLGPVKVSIGDLLFPTKEEAEARRVANIRAGIRIHQSRIQELERLLDPVEKGT